MACHFCWVSSKKLAVDDTKSYPAFTFRHSLKAAADFSPSPGLSALGNSFKVLLTHEQVDWCLSSLFPPLPSQATSQPVLPPSLLLSLRSYWCYHNWLGHHCEGKLQQKKQHPVPQSSTLSCVWNAILSLRWFDSGAKGKGSYGKIDTVSRSPLASPSLVFSSHPLFFVLISSLCWQAQSPLSWLLTQLPISCPRRS